MAVRGLFTGDLNDVSFLQSPVPRRRAPQHQQTVLDREAARRRTWSTAVRARSRSSRRRRAGRRGTTERRRSGRSRNTMTTWSSIPATSKSPARHVVVTIPPALVARDRRSIRHSPTIASRCTAPPSRARSRRRSWSTTSRSGAPTGSAARPPSRRSAAEVTLDASPASRKPRRHRIVHLRSGRGPFRRARSGRPAQVA